MKRFALLAAGLMMASAALAQKPPSAPETGSREQSATSAKVPISPPISDKTKARMELNRYGACVANDRPKETAEYLALYPYASKAYALEKKLAQVDKCLTEGTLKFDSYSLRGALYDAMYIQNFSNDVPTLQPFPIDFAADIAGDTSDQAKKYVVMRELGECLIRKEPVVARNLVLGPIGSESETVAFKALAPLIGECLPSNITTEIDKSGLIQIVAEVLYRLSVGGTNTSAAGAK